MLAAQSHMLMPMPKNMEAASAGYSPQMTASSVLFDPQQQWQQQVLLSVLNSPSHASLGSVLEWLGLCSNWCELLMILVEPSVSIALVLKI